jgi:putative cardiolipin synthase
MKGILALLVAELVVAALTGCASLPSLEGRSESTAYVDTEGTRIGRAVAADVAANPGRTGIHPLPDPHDAFAARAAFCAGAERSLDVQYYIWNGDRVGYLLFEALWKAAERGVRVRLLLDDMNTSGLDATLSALDGHSNIEVRLYNPFVQRSARSIAFLTDFSRVNRRMHNKSLTVDNQITIVGGRNIGNEYFGAESEISFADLDVVAVGAVVSDVSRQFDLYWNSPSAYPAASIVHPPGPDATAALMARIAAVHADPESASYLQAIATTPVVRELLDRHLALEWAPARLVNDDPAKTLDTKERKDVLMFPELVKVIGAPEASFDLVSPYLVPGEKGPESLAQLAERGVNIRILTNSLASSESGVVFSGYAKRRKALLRAGVQLWETKPMIGQAARKEKSGSSSAALHAKTFAVDRDTVFVGSFNFDPRSALLNTELGLVIESPSLAQGLSEFFDKVVPGKAYEVRLKSDGSSIEWIERTESGETVYDADPGTGSFKRMGVHVLSVFPIDWLL